MAEDIARLGFEIDTKALEKGIKKLGLLRKESDKVEDSTKDLNLGFKGISKQLDRLNSNVKKITRLLEGYAGGLNKIEKKTESVKKSTQKLNSSFKNTLKTSNLAKKGILGLIGDLKKLRPKLFGIKSLIATIGLAYLGKQFIDAAASAERLRIRLDAFTKGQGAAYFEKLNKWAALLPVNTEDAVETFTKLQAYGLKPSIDLMTTLVDTTTALGGEADSLSGIARALGQIQTKGRVSAEEINQLAEQGVNARKYLKQAFDLIPSDFNEIDAAVKKSGHSTAEAIQAIISGMKDEFGGMSERIQNSWQGLMNRMKHQWFNFRRITMEKGIFQTIKQQLQKFLEFLESPAGTKAMERWAQKISDVIFEASIFSVRVLGKIVDAIGGIGSEIKRLALEFKKLPVVGDEQYKGYTSAKQSLPDLIKSQQKALRDYSKATSELKDSALPGQVESRISFLDKTIDAITNKIQESRNIISKYEKENPLFKDSEKQVETFGSSFKKVLSGIEKDLIKNKELFKGGILGGEIKEGVKIDQGLADAASRFGSFLKTITPRKQMLKDYQMDLKAINDAWIYDLIPSAKEYNDLIFELQKKYQDLREQNVSLGITKGARSYLESVKDLATQTENLFTNTFSNMENAFVNFVQTGKASFKDLANSIIGDISRILVRQSILGPLAQGLGGMFSPIWTTDYSSPITHNPIQNAKGNVFSGAGISAYSNQVVSSPTIFPFAKGTGLMGEAGPEAIMPLTRTSNGDLGIKTEGVTGSNVSIQVIDQRSNSNSEAIKTEESTGPDGQRMVRIMVRDEVRAGTSNGAFDSTFRGSMGLTRKPVRR